jgi:hypothetical protein
MFNKSDKVMIAKCKSAPSFAAAAYLIFKLEKGQAVDTIRAFEVIQDEKYQVDDSKTKKKVDRVRTVRRFVFFIDNYFFFAPTNGSFDYANFELTREILPEEELYSNYFKECEKAKQQLVLEREQSKIATGPMNV